jgi:hypothetical protein
LNAAPLLVRVAKLLRQHNLEAILIGNAAAALQGAPVTFLFRKTPASMKKLKALAGSLDAFILRTYYPVSGLYRIARDEDGLQLDFMTVIDGILTVAALSDIIKSKKAAGRARDLAVLNVLEKALDEESRLPKGKAGSSQEGK